MKPHHIEGLKLLFLLGVCGIVLFSYQKDTNAFDVANGNSEPAAYRVIFTNENWLTVPHPKVAEFTVLEDGSAHGITETGIPFYQYTITSTPSVRIQRFEIEEHYHYIINGTVVYTEAELSIALANAMNQPA